MHEVTVESGYSSVSFSLHTGCPYPILSLYREIRDANHGQEIGLQEKYSRIEKKEITFFQPGRFHSEEDNRKTMPKLLRETLCEAIIAEGHVKDELGQKLDLWWKEKTENPTYAGPYPRNE